MSKPLLKVISPGSQTDTRPISQTSGTYGTESGQPGNHVPNQSASPSCKLTSLTVSLRVYHILLNSLSVWLCISNYWSLSLCLSLSLCQPIYLLIISVCLCLFVRLCIYPYLFVCLYLSQSVIPFLPILFLLAVPSFLTYPISLSYAPSFLD